MDPCLHDARGKEKNEKGCSPLPVQVSGEKVMKSLAMLRSY
jgi:hypothetical protein